MSLLQSNPLINAAANIKIVAISLANADSLLKLGGAGGLPYNNAAAQLVGTTIDAVVTPMTGMPKLASSNLFTQTQTVTIASTAGFSALSGGAINWTGYRFGRVADEAHLVIVGAANSGLLGTAPGDIALLPYSAAASVFLGCGTGQLAAIKITGPDVLINGHLRLGGDGSGMSVKTSGAAATMGTVVMNGSTPVVVNTTKVTVTSLIFFGVQNIAGGIGTPTVAGRTPGVSFTVKSSSNTDTSLVAWWLIEPIP